MKMGKLKIKKGNVKNIHFAFDVKNINFAFDVKNVHFAFDVKNVHFAFDVKYIYFVFFCLSSFFASAASRQKWFFVRRAGISEFMYFW